MRYIVVIVVFIALSGCGSVRSAKADRIRAQTEQARQIHNQALREKKATAEIRVIAKRFAIATGTTSLAIFLIGGSAILIYGLGGFTHSFVVFCKAQARKEQVAAEIYTREFNPAMLPVLIKGDRYYLPATGQRFNIAEDSEPNPMLTDGSHAIQMIGAGAPKSPPAPKTIEMIGE